MNKNGAHQHSHVDEGNSHQQLRQHRQNRQRQHQQEHIRHLNIQNSISPVNSFVSNAGQGTNISQGTSMHSNTSNELRNDNFAITRAEVDNEAPPAWAETFSSFPETPLDNWDEESDDVNFARSSSNAILFDNFDESIFEFEQSYPSNMQFQQQQSGSQIQRQEQHWHHEKSIKKAREAKVPDIGTMPITNTNQANNSTTGNINNQGPVHPKSLRDWIAASTTSKATTHSCINNYSVTIRQNVPSLPVMFHNRNNLGHFRPAIKEMDRAIEGSICPSLPTNRDVYLENAVHIALLLARRLAQLLSQPVAQRNQDISQEKVENKVSPDPFTSFCSITAKDLVADNIVVFTRCYDHTNKLSVEEVDFRTKSGSYNDDLNRSSSAGIIPQILRALGILLFEIFSKGNILYTPQSNDAKGIARIGRPKEWNEGYDTNQLYSDNDLFPANYSNEAQGHDERSTAPSQYQKIHGSHTKKRKGRIVNQNDKNRAIDEQHENYLQKRGEIIPPLSSILSSPLPKIETTSLSSHARAYLNSIGTPISVCRLVSDLIDADSSSILRPDSAFSSLEEVVSDLTQMNDIPDFLYDNTSIDRAFEKLLPLLSLQKHINPGIKLEHTPMYGREKERKKLLELAYSVLSHTRSKSVLLSTDSSSDLYGHSHPGNTCNDSRMHCEVALLSGHSGCGKSRLTHWLMDSFSLNPNEWFVVSCKFDRNTSSLMTMAKAFDLFFEEFVVKEDQPNLIEQPRRELFHRILQSIIVSIDKEGLYRLSELIPNLCRVLPMGIIQYQNRRSSFINCSYSDDLETPLPPTGKNLHDVFATSIYKTGAGKNRLNHLFQLLVRALRCGSIPLAILLDDLQWADPSSLEVIGNFVTSTGEESIVASHDNSNCGGLLLLGNYRDNEVDDKLIQLIQSIEDNCEHVNVTKMAIDGITKEDINQMLSINLCLPTRITGPLANIVYQKTVGNPLFVIEFLKSLISNKTLSFSVKDRRWVWDEDSIEIKVISKNVAELLARKLSQFPESILHCLKVVSCFGSQVNESTMLLLNRGQTEYDMILALDKVVEEGLMEKAGSIYAFTHDMVQQAAYELIPIEERVSFHQGIGMLLGKELRTGNMNTEILFLAVEQISACKGGEIMTEEERTLFAQLYLSAGKSSIAMSSFERASHYLEVGISFLSEDHWQSQYPLSMAIYELSVSACLMNGVVDSMSSRLDEILRNARSFRDSLNANALLVKLLGSSGKYAESVQSCLRILSSLGEGLPASFDTSYVRNEVMRTRSLLKDVTIDRVMKFPPMTDFSKISAMKFMSILSTYSYVHKPILMPILACKMIGLSLQYGFCEESITGLAMFSHLLTSIAGDISTSVRIGKISEYLVRGKPNESALRARHSIFLYGYSRCLVEPHQSMRIHYLDAYKAGMMAGDLESAGMNAYIYCVMAIYNGTELRSLERDFMIFSQKMVKHRQYNFLFNATSSLRVCTSLSGSSIPENISRKIEMKSDDELIAIGEATNNELLLQQIYFNQIFVKFWFRDFIEVAALAEKYKIGKSKRSLDFFFTFYYGLAVLNLGRVTKDPKWKQVGSELILTMEEWADRCKWNFEDKLFLMKAEMYFLEGNDERAELTYEAAIMSAHEHHFIYKEGLACELYGLFLMEKSRLDKSLEQFQVAFKKYVMWGAYKKAESVKFFIDYANSKNWQEKCDH